MLVAEIEAFSGWTVVVLLGMAKGQILRPNSALFMS